MRLAVLVVAAAVFMSAGVSASARGHHAAPIIIAVPSRTGPIYTGAPAFIPLLMPAPSAIEENGALAPGVVVGARALKPEAAVVLTEGVDDNGVIITAGTVLVRVDLTNPKNAAKPDDAALTSVWCSVRLMPTGHAFTQDCLRDSKGAGTFDQFWTGYVADRNAPFSLLGVSYVRGIAKAAYRSAGADEIPAVEVGYMLCKSQGDGVSMPWRFASTMRTTRGDWTQPFGACPFGTWPDPADRSVETADSLTLKIEGDAAPHFHVLASLPAGPLAPVRIGEAIQPKGSLSLEDKRRLEALGSAPLVPAGRATVAEGLIAHGALIASAPVVHGVTGVLSNDVQVKNPFFNTDRLPAGQYVFGIPMSSSSTYQTQSHTAVTWCAPRVQEASKDTGAMHIATVCFPPVGTGNLAVEAGSALMVTHFYFRSGREVIGLVVERKPAVFTAPMTLAYVFDRWVPQTVGADQVVMAQIGVEIRVNGIATPVDHIRVAPAKDKTYRLPLMGGMLTLAIPSRDGAKMTLPGVAMAPVIIDQVFDQIDKNRVIVAVSVPPKDAGALPLTGFIQVQPVEAGAVPAPNPPVPSEVATIAPAAP